MLPLVKPRAADDDHHYNIIINIIINIVINIIDIKIIIMNIVINIIINMKQEQQSTKTTTTAHPAGGRKTEEGPMWPFGGLGRPSGAHFGIRFGAILEPFLNTFFGALK